MSKPRADLAQTFQLPGVAAAYRARPPYPPETIATLATLAGGGPVLDLGAGEGALARPLSEHVTRVDAIEVSPAMVAAGSALPGGDRPNLRWIIEPVETFTPDGRYGLAVAGDAMHWFDLEKVMPRLAEMLLPDAVLALATRSARGPGLDAIGDVIARYSRAPEHDASYDVATDLSERALWRPVGRAESQPAGFRQSPRDHLLSLRSTASLARELMTERENLAFDREILAITEPLVGPDGMLELTVKGQVVWGLPTTSKQPGRT